MLRIAGTEELARSPHLSGLETLLIGSNWVADAGLMALAGAGLPRLRRLDLSSNGIGPAGVSALAASPLVAQLDALLLSHNPVGPDGAGALAASEHLCERGHLTTVELYGCELGDAGVASLAAAPWASLLRRLYLGDNGIGEEGVEALVESPFLSGLTDLDVRFEHLTDEAWFALRGRFGMAVRLWEPMLASPARPRPSPPSTS
jgi:Ran GTPase-activating protein (RanGAP) involved in mRNA processing and transport